MLKKTVVVVGVFLNRVCLVIFIIVIFMLLVGVF